MEQKSHKTSHPLKLINNNPYVVLFCFLIVYLFLGYLTEFQFDSPGLNYWGSAFCESNPIPNITEEEEVVLNNNGIGLIEPEDTPTLGKE